MKYFAIMLAALTLATPAFAQREQGPSRRPQARVEAPKAAALKAEVKALRRELEALKREVAELKKRGNGRRRGSGAGQRAGRAMKDENGVVHQGRGRFQGEGKRHPMGERPAVPEVWNRKGAGQKWTKNGVPTDKRPWDRKKGAKKGEVQRPDWEAIRQRMGEFRKSRK